MGGQCFLDKLTRGGAGRGSPIFCFIAFLLTRFLKFARGAGVLWHTPITPCVCIYECILLRSFFCVGSCLLLKKKSLIVFFIWVRGVLSHTLFTPNHSVCGSMSVFYLDHYLCSCLLLNKKGWIVFFIWVFIRRRCYLFSNAWLVCETGSSEWVKG